jgi:alkyl sulfatase BDS1-like metallo-beta-lactamase superfamily hydrolase
MEARMASVEECAAAFQTLADRMAAMDPEARAKNALSRTLSCRITDLDTVFGARLHDGLLTDIRTVKTVDGQVKLAMSSDDLVAMVAGEKNFASLWASGRVKIDASVLDLLRLRSLF